MYLFTLIIIIIIIIYNISGIYILIPFILAIINYIAATINLIIDPRNTFS